jgi:hypothetical protein
METEKCLSSGMPDATLETAAQTSVLQPSPLERGNREEVAALAYEYWLQRGCPIGSPEEDWFRAEAEINDRKAIGAAAGS